MWIAGKRLAREAYFANQIAIAIALAMHGDKPWGGSGDGTSHQGKDYYAMFFHFQTAEGDHVKVQHSHSETSCNEYVVQWFKSSAVQVTLSTLVLGCIKLLTRCHRPLWM